MSTKRTMWTRITESAGRVTGPFTARPWRLAALLGAMVAIMVGAMLFGSPADEAERAELGLGTAADPTGLEAPDSGLVPGPGAAGDTPTSDTNGTAGTGDGGSRPGGDSGGSAGTGGGSSPAPSPTVEDPATVVTKPPATSTQPVAPSNPVGTLDNEFGESMFPETYPGLQLVLAFDVEDTEVTATYKSDNATRFDIVRITVQQASSADEVARVHDSTLALYGPERTGYTWGGRDITQAIGVLGAGGDQQALGFVWRQGRYCIDVTVYPPYRDDIADGRSAALEFIGRLGY